MSQHFKIQRLGVNDKEIAEQLFKLFRSVFKEDDPVITERQRTEDLLANPAFVCFAAMNNYEVIGGLTAYELPMYHSLGSEMFIYDVAVHADHQRKGVGTLLISAISEYCRTNGIRQLFVDANVENDHALEFYKATGATESRVSQFTYLIKS